MSIPTNVDAITISKTGGIEVIEKTTVKLDDDPSHIIVKVRDEPIYEIFFPLLKRSN
ncbi:NADPH:quinone reductase [Pleurotus ostreatus]|nr:NADPH:quinone reductase [Pleurotus ostreatus]